MIFLCILSNPLEWKFLYHIYIKLNISSDQLQKNVKFVVEPRRNHHYLNIRDFKLSLQEREKKSVSPQQKYTFINTKTQMRNIKIYAHFIISYK